jgi:hypothetical protein
LPGAPSKGSILLMARAYKTVTAQALHFLLRPHTSIPDGPVTSPAAWRGDDLRGSERWIDRLDGSDVAEIEAALAHARRTGKPLGELVADDFPLPSLGARLARWRAAVAEGLGVQIVKGVPVERWSTADCERLFWCVGQHLGTAGAQNREGDLLGHVRDQGLSYDDPSVRGYKTAARLDYHCDAADAVGLLCLRTAKEGGTSRFVSSVTVWNALHSRRPDLAARLFKPIAFDTRGDGGLDFFTVPPCRFSDGVLRTFYHADYFRTAERQPGAPRLSQLDREMLDTYDDIARTPGVYVDMDFEPGDIQLLSNHTVLHSRSDYVDFEEEEKKRHLLRLWLSFARPRSLRALPPLGREAVRLVAALGAGRLRKRIHA